MVLQQNVECYRMKLKFIDTTRGIAILMVILVHTSQQINDIDLISSIVAGYGQMGVQLFFIVSAYTLCLSSYRRDKESLPLIKFGIRRYFRIAPAYYLALLIYLLISIIISKFHEGEFNLPDKYTFENVLTNIFLLHGFYPPANNNIVPGGWSIGTEMAFYALFPLLFFIIRFKLKSSLRYILFFVIAGILCSQFMIYFLGQFNYNISNNNFIYFNIINQLPVFLICMGYFFLKRQLTFQINWKLNFLFFVFFMILAIYLGYSGVDYYFSFIPLISSLSFVFLIELFQKFDFLNQKILIRIGQVSFSMYLIHFIFAQTITGFLATRVVFINGTISLLIFYLFSVLITFGFSLLSERYIEKPSVKYGKKIIQKLDHRFTAPAITQNRKIN